MFNALYLYLINNRQVFLEGIGLFRLVRKPADFNFASHTILPPMQIIEIQQAVSDFNVQHLIAFLARQTGIEEEAMYGNYKKFCSLQNRELVNSGSITWPGLGKITITASHAARIKLDTAVSDYLPPVPAERVIVEGAAHNMVVGEKETTTSEMRDWLTEQGQALNSEREWIQAAIIIGLVAAILVTLRLMHFI